MDQCFGEIFEYQSVPSKSTDVTDNGMQSS